MARQSKLDTLDRTQIEFIKTIYYSENMSHNEKMDVLTERYDVSPRTMRRWWNRLSLTQNPHNLPKQLIEARDKEIPEGTDVVIVTAAQNKTTVNKEQLKNIEAYRDWIQEERGLKCEIVIIPARYRNPTSPSEEVYKKGEEWWMPEIEKHLYYNKLMFGDVFIAADTRVRPTAKMPLTSFEAMAGDHHLILGHPRIHLKCMSRFKGEPLRVLVSTGYLTYKNYSDSKAGDISFVHHSQGCTILERSESDPERCLPPRTVKVRTDGSFVDVGNEVKDGKVTPVEESEALMWGDIHLRELDTDKVEATNTLVSKVKPKKHVLDDIYDGSTINYHEKNDLYIRRKKIREDQYSVEDEEKELLDYISSFVRNYDGDLIIKQSNHDDFIDKWVNQYDWKKDLHNSEMYLRYAMIQQTKDLEEYGNILGYIIKDTFGDQVDYLPEDASLRIRGYQVGKHGHQGANGSRGSARSFKKMNTKMVTAHSHTPVIMDGVTGVGVSCKIWQYYNRGGASSWAHADCVIYGNGKNQLIVYDDNYEFTRLL